MKNMQELEEQAKKEVEDKIRELIVKEGITDEEQIIDRLRREFNS